MVSVKCFTCKKMVNSTDGNYYKMGKNGTRWGGMCPTCGGSVSGIVSKPPSGTHILPARTSTGPKKRSSKKSSGSKKGGRGSSKRGRRSSRK